MRKSRLPVLYDTLGVLLPTAEQTPFLQSCLLRGAPLRQAWQEWCAADPFAFLAGPGRELRGNLTLLYRNVAQEALEIPPTVQPYLKTAVLRGKLRYQKYEACLRDAIAALADVPVTWLKGVAIATSMFEEPYRRHCHDADLFVPAERVDAAVAALRAHGFELPPQRQEMNRAGTIRVDHPVGLPIMLHTRLLHDPVYALSVAPFLERRVPVQASFGDGHVLHPADQLVHTLGHAATAVRRPHYNWVIDATLLGRQLVDDDWQRVLESIASAGLDLPCAVMLDYLDGNGFMRVPADVQATVLARAYDTDRAHRANAVDNARLGDPGGVRRSLAHSDARSKRALAAAMAMPPASYLRARAGTDGARLSSPGLLAEYLRRPLRFLWHRRPARLRGQVTADALAVTETAAPPTAESVAKEAS